MNKIDEFANIIKYDCLKCDTCKKCVNICPCEALKFNDDKLIFDVNKCIKCQNCIKVCHSHALYYNVNYAKEKQQKICIIPPLANKSFLSTKYETIYTTSLAEKIICIEVAFNFEKYCSNILNQLITSNYYLIYSDFSNISQIISMNYKDLKNNVISLQNPYYIQEDIIRRNKNNKNVIIDMYGVLFENKTDMIKDNINLYDIPYKYEPLYNILDILKIFSSLTKTKSSIKLDKLDTAKTKLITFYNKMVSINFVICKTINEIETLKQTNKNTIYLLLKDTIYIANDIDILKDNEVNEIYKKLLKAPLKTNSFYI